MSGSIMSGQYHTLFINQRRQVFFCKHFIGNLQYSSQLAAAKKQLVGQIGVASDNFENNALGMAKTYQWFYHVRIVSYIIYKST